MTVPVTQPAGDYTGTATISANRVTSRKATIVLTVTSSVAKNSGVDEPWKQTRLAWLNSQLAASDEVIAPYTALQLQGSAISLLGRKLEVADNGLPRQITSYFSPLMTKMENVGHPLLTGGFDFLVEVKNKGMSQWTQAGKPKITKISDGAVTWTVTNTAENLSLEVSGRLSSMVLFNTP